MNEKPLALLPELILVVGATATLLVGIFAPRQRQWLARLVAAAALLGSLVAGAAALAGSDELIYDGSWAVDGLTGAARLVVPAAALLTIGLSVDRFGGTTRETEFYVLVLLASLGAIVLCGANDLLVLAAGYLLASIPLYALAGIARDAAGTEAALKLYLVAALLGIALLGGVTVLFGVAGATAYADLAEGLRSASSVGTAAGLVGVLGGLLFKMGAVPAHFWVPDATEGATTPAAAFLTTVPKVGGLFAAFRLLSAVPDEVVDWPLLVAALAAVSMTLGNFAAFRQDSPKRLLAYSTISQVGYLLMAVAVAGRSDLALQSLSFYVAAYAVTNLGAFALVAALPDATTLASYRALAWRSPWLAGVLLVCLLGLVGTPPTAVFLGKVEVFGAAIDGGLGWLAVVAVINTVVSLFYYLRWLAPTFAPERTTLERHVAPRPYSRVAALTAGLSVLALGVAAGPALDLVDGRLLR